MALRPPTVLPLPPSLMSVFDIHEQRKSGKGTILPTFRTVGFLEKTAFKIRQFPISRFAQQRGMQSLHKPTNKYNLRQRQRLSPRKRPWKHVLRGRRSRAIHPVCALLSKERCRSFEGECPIYTRGPLHFCTTYLGIRVIQRPL